MQEILVIPRECIHGLEGFLPWIEASELIDTVPDLVSWMPRAEAELSEQWVQPIPCAIFKDSSGRYCLFRQARQTRADLSRRISLIIGGHIDSNYNSEEIRGVLTETVRREAAEELGVTLDCKLKPIGIAIDASSPAASRHFGVIYEATIDDNFRPTDTDELVVGSPYHGQFYDLEALSKLILHQRPRLRFDPWSFIIFSQYLGREHSGDLGHQPMLSLPTE